MTNSQSTKRALLTSTLSVLLCVAMLLGTTFAWFTDQASTAANKIQAGTLDVQLLDAEGNDLEGQTLAWQKAEGHENDEVLWEPGCTYNLESFKIKNNGNLALKYKVMITGIDGDAELNEVIDWTYTVNSEEFAVDDEGHLLAGAETDLITISGHMKETAGNEYQGLSIEGIAITVIATQDTVESDSYNNTYDENVQYPVVDSQELVDTIANATVGDTIVLAPGTDYELSAAPNQGVQITEGVTIDGNDATLTVDGGMSESDTYDRLYAEGVTFKNVVFDADKLYIKGKMTFINCTFNAPIQDAQAVVGTVKFENCTFNNTVHFAPDDPSAPTTGKFFEAEGCTFAKVLTVQGFEKVTLKGCTLTGTNWSRMNMVSYCPVNVENCNFSAGIRIDNNLVTVDGITCTGGTVTVSWSGGSATVGA